MSKKNNSQEKITSNGVKHIAKLARLGLTEKEIEKHQKEFLKILDYIEKLKEVDTSKVKHESSFLEMKNIMREDKVLNFNNANKHSERSVEKRRSLFEQKLIKGHLKVKSIL